MEPLGSFGGAGALKMEPLGVILGVKMEAWGATGDTSGQIPVFYQILDTF